MGHMQICNMEFLSYNHFHNQNLKCTILWFHPAHKIIVFNGLHCVFWQEVLKISGLALIVDALALETFNGYHGTHQSFSVKLGQCRQQHPALVSIPNVTPPLGFVQTSVWNHSVLSSGFYHMLPSSYHKDARERHLASVVTLETMWRSQTLTHLHCFG